MARALDDMFDKANAFIDCILVAPAEQIDGLIEQVAACQYAGASSHGAARSRQAIYTLLDNPKSMDNRRCVLGYILHNAHNFQHPVANTASSLGAKPRFYAEGLLPV